MEKINQAITGICSFSKFPICMDLDNLGDAHMAVLGVPYDLGVGFLSGARLGPAESEKLLLNTPKGLQDFMILKMMNNILHLL
ncbi:hypothetical protein [Aminipila terrae]|uniref:hypothetical protein n=1 Tax=Aminipila terrae TaxID=2697030 RepID=UPI002ED508A9